MDSPTTTIEYDDFAKLELRVATVLDCKPHANADKLLVLQIDLGGETRQICAGLRQHYQPEQLIGKQIVVVANLAPRQMRGEISQGMLLAATDAVVWYVFPGFSLHDELELFVKAGLTPMEALQTATLNPAIYLGLSDTVGTVEQGKKADLLLLDASPLENISNTKRINAVIVNGRLIPRDSLDKMLKDVEAAANRN